MRLQLWCMYGGRGKKMRSANEKSCLVTVKSGQKHLKHHHIRSHLHAPSELFPQGPTIKPVLDSVTEILVILKALCNADEFCKGLPALSLHACVHQSINSLTDLLQSIGSCVIIRCILSRALVTNFGKEFVAVFPGAHHLECLSANAFNISSCLHMSFKSVHKRHSSTKNQLHVGRQICMPSYAYILCPAAKTVNNQHPRTVTEHNCSRPTISNRSLPAPCLLSCLSQPVRLWHTSHAACRQHLPSAQ